MNKKIVKSVLMIGAVLAMVGGATFALFSDTETSSGNTFSAGTIDIAVDGENPWSVTHGYQLEDMKPSYTDYINFTIENVGSNPADVWKTIDVTGFSTGLESEPECEDEGGTWDNTGAGFCNGNVSKNDIDTVIDYDLWVELYDGDPEAGGNLIWWQMLYDKDVTIDEIEDTKMYLGMIPTGWYMKVYQSYHMQEKTGNWAQGDKMTFDITLYAEQLTGNLTLENKTGDPDWDIIQDGTSGTLTYNVKGPKFEYAFTGTGLANTTGYSLIYYADGWPGNNPGALIASGTSDGSGGLSLSGSVELGMDLPHTSDANYPGGAKIWLVLSSDYSVGTKSMTGWNPGSYLFETGLIEYDDTDL